MAELLQILVSDSGKDHLTRAIANSFGIVIYSLQLVKFDRVVNIK